MREHMQFMSERGVMAMTPGEALDSVISHLQIDQTRIHSFKAWTAKPMQLSDFSEDCQFLNCLGTGRSVKDIWLKRYDS